VKKVLASIAAIGLIGIAAPAAHAQDGTINFTGTLLQQTCEVSSGEKTLSVKLPNVPIGMLNTGGGAGTIGDTSFEIHVEKCNASPNTVTAVFMSDNVTPEGRLANATPAGNGGAENVWLELTDNDGRMIKVNDDADQKANGTYATIAGGAATLKYTAKYYADPSAGAVTAGTITGTVTYTFAYP